MRIGVGNKVREKAYEFAVMGMHEKEEGKPRYIHS